ncbi:hypothetical protein [Bacillus sp. NSP9.1]|uniref:hypothetical protein n=1 Tax=Bacillus sp. NSP9.1 TaxID=1071078 RepID=UPI0004205086|nr:hypothetical protein [Bacillus sp. NSP9.1]QHZ46989.1 hypothetical protein M654_012110 [Bacillus sp. NSP9.1]
MCIEKPSLTKGLKLSKEKPPLLRIELDDINSIPHVLYKGEKITDRIEIDFEWRTADAEHIGSAYFRIKHSIDRNGRPAVETKELEIGSRVYE